MKELNCYQDLKGAEELMKNQSLHPAEVYSHYAPIFNNFNINQRELFQSLIQQNESYLGVLSSSDAFFNILCYGTKKATLFDINILNVYYLFLKIASILELSKEEYIKFYYDTTKNHYMDQFYFKKLENSLEGHAKYFWCMLYQNYSKEEISKLFAMNLGEERAHFHNHSFLIPSNLYLEEEHYKLMKERLKQMKQLRVIVGDYKTIWKDISYDSYDVINLSNLFAIDKTVSKEEKIAVINQYYKMLNKRGILIANTVTQTVYNSETYQTEKMIEQFCLSGYECSLIPEYTLDKMPNPNKHYQKYLSHIITKQMK